MRFSSTERLIVPAQWSIDLHQQLEAEISAFKHLHSYLNAWMALMDAFCHEIPVPGFQYRDFNSHGCPQPWLHCLQSSMQVPVPVRCLEIVPESESKHRHCNVDDLARKLYRYARPDDRIMVVSDAVFSMDGDIAPLPDMLDVLQITKAACYSWMRCQWCDGATGRGSTNILVSCLNERLSGGGASNYDDFL